jgi:hypothetical protein
VGDERRTGDGRHGALSRPRAARAVRLKAGGRDGGATTTVLRK